MKKTIIFTVCVVFIVFFSYKQTPCYACRAHKGYEKFTELLSKQSEVIDIQGGWDFSVKKIKAKCSEQVTIEGKEYYSVRKKITLLPGQILLIPKGCVFLSNTRSSILGVNTYEAVSNISGYLACSSESTISCNITKKVILPPNTILRFSEGTIENGVIDMSGGYIESDNKHILENCILSNLGNKKVYGRWFFNDNQEISSDDLEVFKKKEVDFGKLYLMASDVIRVTDVHWTNLNLNAPKIIIGNTNKLTFGFTIWKSNKNPHSNIETDIDLSSYIGDIILLSFGEPVHYDKREKDGLPTLHRGLATIIESSMNGSFAVYDEVEEFEKTYLYKSSDGTDKLLRSNGFVYKPCTVWLDSCNFYSTERVSPGFMYIYSGKDIHISNSSWIASAEGAQSLLGINNSVQGEIVNCFFKGAIFTGTQTSYGLQTINSTRIFVKDCVLEGNRRGVDFSGNVCQSRYCVVENCKVSGDIIEHEGSGLGGHSTSYGNIYRNNIIEGSSSRIGIETRGEREIIEGNTFKLPFSAAAITCVENTIIRNNVCEYGNTPTFVWIESISKDGNNIIVENNIFEGNNLVRGQKELTCKVTIKGNTFKYVSPTSSFAPVGDNVMVYSTDNTLIRGKENAVLYFKYNNVKKPAISEGLGEKDKVEIRFSREGKLLD